MNQRSRKRIAAYSLTRRAPLSDENALDTGRDTKQIEIDDSRCCSETG